MSAPGRWAKLYSVFRTVATPKSGKKGFSTIELMIAFALLTLVLTGVIIAQFSATYWQLAAQTSNEALYIAKTHLEIERGAARGEFTMASSTPTTKNPDAPCLAGGLCYYVTDTVTELSACAKYIHSLVAWSVQNYPTTTTSLFTTITSPNEAILLGGDCPLVSPAGTWTKTPTALRSLVLNGNATGIDTLDGNGYVSLDAAPYFASVHAAGSIYQIPIGETVALNGVDVARDQATGRIYAYVARNSATKQLGIIDLTDISHPATTTLPFALGMNGDVTSPNAFGWRVSLYDRKAYVVTKQTGQPDFHVVDVANPVLPIEKGDYTLNTTVNDLVIRDRKIAGTTHRFAYLATTNPTKEVIILDVTNPTSITLVSYLDIPETGCGLADPPDATTLSLVGTTLHIGREYSGVSCPSLETLYIVDVTTPGTPTLTRKIRTDATIVGLRVAGGFAYIQSTSQVAAPSTSLLDIDSTYLYVGRPIASGTQKVSVWNVANGTQLANGYTIANTFTVLQDTP